MYTKVICITKGQKRNFVLRGHYFEFREKQINSFQEHCEQFNILTYDDCEQNILALETHTAFHHYLPMRKELGIPAYSKFVYNY